MLGFDQISFFLVVCSADTPSHSFSPTVKVGLDSGLIFTSHCFCASNVLQDVSSTPWDAAVPSRLSSELLQMLLKAPTASTSITLQSMKGMDAYRTPTNKLILTALFKITHCFGPEGCQAKETTANLPSATHPTECAVCNVSLLGEPNFPGWTKGLGLPQSCNFLPLEAWRRQYSPCQHEGLVAPAGSSAAATSLGDMYGNTRIQAWPSVFFFPGKVLKKSAFSAVFWSRR